MCDWKINWEELSATTSQGGGQGIIKKVRHRSDGTVAALKQLHDQYLDDKKRRFRMQQEVSALRAIGGQGVPRVIETNVEEHWKTKGVPLYVVMDWVDGGTLGRYVAGRPIPLDEALEITRKILNTIGQCNDFGILHRDIKPDNVALVLETLTPIVLDFGMSWTRPPEGQKREMDTPSDVELGNRFLRLPEHSPGHHAYDFSSDLTMVVGLLFYMLTGEQPRLLRSSPGGLKPHERHETRFSLATTSDIRWRRLRRIFDAGFQYDHELRFTSCEDILSRLNNLNPPQAEDDEGAWEEERARIEDLLNSKRARQLEEVRGPLMVASSRCWDELKRRLEELGFAFGGGGPSLIEGGQVVKFQAVIFPSKDASAPLVQCIHEIRVDANKLVASTVFDNHQREEYFRDTLGDPDALREAVILQVPRIATKMAALMRQKLTSYY